MSGHSKWHNIAEKKGKTDSQRAKAFTQLARYITIAVRKGGPDASFNFALRTAIEKAKEGNVPKDNIERAIKKGTGELAGEEIVQNRYEGYGPGGVAMIVDTMTDNANRTVADLKHLFSKMGGNLAGSVAWQFDNKGVIHIVGAAAKASDDDWMLQLLDNGGDNAEADGDDLIVLTAPNKLQAVKDWLETLGLKAASSQLSLLPKETMAVDGDVKTQLMKLIEAVEEMDDVEKVWHNAQL